MLTENNQSKIDIVIVNFNSGKYLSKCVSSILAGDISRVGEIVIIDNASTDGSLSSLGAGETTIVRSETNLGFAAACNIGAFRCTSDYILFLNPDTEVEEHTITSALYALQEREADGYQILGVALRGSSGTVARSCSRFPSPLRLIGASIGLNRVWQRTGCRMVEWDHLTSGQVDQVIGAFFLVPKELFIELGGFDETFFVYYEEVDFCYRAIEVGAFCWFESGISASHIGGGCSGSVVAKRLFYSLRSKLLYSQKHFSRMSYFAVLVAALFVEPIARLGFALLTNPSALPEVLGAYGSLYRWSLTTHFLSSEK